MSYADNRFSNDKRRRPEDHKRQRWLTPDYVLGPVRSVLGSIDLDPCTEPDNPVGAASFYTPPDDGAELPWSGRIFVNPPYGEARVRWVDRCIEESTKGHQIILLVPASTDTRIFQKAIEACTSVLFLKGRLKFGIPRANGRQEAASHPSALIGFNVCLSPISKLGVVLS